MHRKLVAALAGTAAALLATTALAAPAPAHAGTAALVTQTVKIDYSDLDLESPKAVDRLYARLRSAAKRVCGESDVRHLQGNRLQRDCMRQAMDRAVAQVGHAALTAKHAERKPARYAQVSTATRGS